MREHIKKSIPVGALFGLIISLLCNAITYYLFAQARVGLRGIDGVKRRGDVRARQPISS